jgi:putative ABC transport system substrate-binding protein
MAIKGTRLIIAVILVMAFVLLSPVMSVQAAGKTIGVIMTGDIDYYQNIHRAFLKGIVGEDVEIFLQKPMPEPMSWANAARKLVVVGSDVIISYGAPATLTTMKVTSDIPIIFAGVYNPQGMNVTGKNATGISSTISIKEVLSDLKSIKGFSKLGVIFNKSEKDTILQAREIKKLEASMGFKSRLFSVKKSIDKAQLKNVDAILLTASCAGMKCINDVVSIARKDSVPTASIIGGGEKLGVILTIAAEAGEQGQEVANMVKTVLGGTSVSNMPVKNPKKIVKIINVKEAKAIGITIKPDLLKTATKIIK